MSQGYLIQNVPCPRCAIRRTVRLREGRSFCFNCRFQWHPAAYQFAPADRARLEVYRAAVRAGFYSDWPGRSLRAA